MKKGNLYKKGRESKKKGANVLRKIIGTHIRPNINTGMRSNNGSGINTRTIPL